MWEKEKVAHAEGKRIQRAIGLVWLDCIPIWEHGESYRVHPDDDQPWPPKPNEQFLKARCFKIVENRPRLPNKEEKYVNFDCSDICTYYGVGSIEPNFNGLRWPVVPTQGQTKKESMKNYCIIIGENNEEASRKVQKELFVAGFKWCFEAGPKHLNEPLLFVSDGEITFADANYLNATHSEFVFISPSDILNGGAFKLDGARKPRRTFTKAEAAIAQSRYHP